MASLTQVTPTEEKIWKGTGPYYQILWDNNALGVLKGPVEDSDMTEVSDITDTTQYGDTPIDGVIIRRGHEITLNHLEWDRTVIAALFGDTTAADYIQEDETVHRLPKGPLIIKGPQLKKKETDVTAEEILSAVECDGTTKVFSYADTAVIANLPIVPGTFTAADDVESFTDNGDGTLTGDGGGSGHIGYEDGKWDLTFNAAPGDADTVEADYTYLDEVYLQKTYYRTACVKKGAVTDSKDGERVLPLTFRLFMDNSRTAQDRLCTPFKVVTV